MLIKKKNKKIIALFTLAGILATFIFALNTISAQSKCGTKPSDDGQCVSGGLGKKIAYSCSCTVDPISKLEDCDWSRTELINNDCGAANTICECRPPQTVPLGCDAGCGIGQRARWNCEYVGNSAPEGDVGQDACGFKAEWKFRCSADASCTAANSVPGTPIDPNNPNLSVFTGPICCGDGQYAGRSCGGNFCTPNNSACVSCGSSCSPSDNSPNGGCIVGSTACNCGTTWFCADSGGTGVWRGGNAQCTVTVQNPINTKRIQQTIMSPVGPGIPSGTGIAVWDPDHEEIPDDQKVAETPVVIDMDTYKDNNSFDAVRFHARIYEIKGNLPNLEIKYEYNPEYLRLTDILVRNNKVDRVSAMQYFDLIHITQGIIYDANILTEAALFDNNDFRDTQFEFLFEPIRPTTSTQENCMEATHFDGNVGRDRVNSDCEPYTIVWPSCSLSAPSAPVIRNPSDGEDMDSNEVILTWDHDGSWGQGCPSTNRFKVFVDEGCDGGAIDYTSNNGGLTESVESFTLSNLNWGSTYCVEMEATNGSISRTSLPVQFNINGGPTLSNSGLASTDICGNGISGRIHQESPDVTNPITYFLDYTDIEGDDIEYIAFAMIPQTGPNAENSANVQADILEGKVKNAKSIAARIRVSDGHIQLLNSNGIYQNKSGDEKLNDFRTATILSSGTISSATGDDASADFQISFGNTFDSGAYNIYAYAYTINNDGTEVTSGATATYNIGYELVDTWEVDIHLPIIGMTIPIYTDTDTFNLLYRASDSESGLKSNSVKVVVSSDTPGTSITDQTTGQTINMPLANTEYDAGINVNNLGRHTYTVNSTGTPTLLFTLSGEDNACNRSDAKALARVPDAWIMGINGMISTLEGVINMNIPNNTPVDISNEAGYNDLAYLGTEEIISGTGFLPDDYISKTDKYIRRYEDNASSTPPNSSYRTWYEHLKDRLEKNLERDDALKETTQIELSGENILNSNNTISTNLTNISGDTVNPGEPVVVFIDDDMLRDGSLTVGRNNICDVQGMFLVNGNITITPNFTNATNTDGCIFISANDLQINKGSRKTSGVLNDGNRSNYDTIEALLIADGTLNFILDDDSNPFDHWDGLHIDGGAVGISYQNDRDLNIDNNVNQPATIFEYDPRYRHLFEEFFKFRGYSIRETSLMRGN